MKNTVFIVVLLMVFMHSCRTGSVVFDGMTRSDIMKLTETERSKINFPPEARAKMYRYKYKTDLKRQDIKGEDRELVRQLYELSLPEAFLPEENEVRTQLNKIGDKIDSLQWNDTKCYLFIGTMLSIREFEKMLPEEYRLTEDFRIVDIRDNKEITLADYVMEYKCFSGRGGRQ